MNEKKCNFFSFVIQNESWIYILLLSQLLISNLRQKIILYFLLFEAFDLSTSENEKE